MSMKKIKRVLIANRAEIALRITRTLKELDIEAIAVYEKPDGDAYHLRFADRIVLIGDGPVKDYLDIGKILRAARDGGADAIHPGYGFLSESVAFAEACEQAGLIFIGPPAMVVRNLGNKVTAREIAFRAGIPLIPGTQNLSSGDAGMDEVKDFVRQHGFPIMLKATAEGGGRGIRILRDGDDIKAQMSQARSEALCAFNDDRIYIEKVIDRARHIEVQILADCYGNVIHLGTRDCSIQRRHQKLLEVAPADLPADLTETLQSAAVAAARAAGYVNAGTVEFLVRPETKEYWFLEVNTRLQVEHTVTEMITGVDIVRRQILIAEGRALDFRQDQVRLNGIAVEARINSEDPRNHFMPEGGKHIDIYQPPGGPFIRLDGAIYRGYRIPAEYDSLLAKLIVWGYEWGQTVRRLRRALGDFTIVGPKTTIPLYLSICDEASFRQRKFDTGYVEAHPLEIGDAVLSGDILIDLEAMKMHTHIVSEVDGRISDILVESGDTVDVGDRLMIIQTGA
jgi:pyruvate carboxylase subunit A